MSLNMPTKFLNLSIFKAVFKLSDYHSSALCKFKQTPKHLHIDVIGVLLS